MANRDTHSTLAQAFFPVKSQLNSQLPLLPDSMRHHSKDSPQVIRGNRYKIWRETRYYGVSSDYRILTKNLFLKRFDNVRDFLKLVLGQPIAEREFTLRLLRLWSYYGKCYLKIADLCTEPGCSKATAFRTLRKLKEIGLVQVIQRFLLPYRRQISSLIRLDGLLLVIARYLAEHGAFVIPGWLKATLALPGSQFWSQFRRVGIAMVPASPLPSLGW